MGETWLNPFRRPPIHAGWGALLGALCGLVAWWLAAQPIPRGLEEWFQDGSFALRGPRETASKVIIVGLDDASLAALPKPLAFASPELAGVVTFLREHGARAIGIDVLVPETLDGFPGLEGAALGHAAAVAENVVLPAVLDDSGRLLLPLRTWQVAPLGLVNLDEDDDGVVRRQSLTGRVGGRAHDQFALALLNVAGRAEADDRGRLRVDGRAVPLDSRGRLRINFVGPPGTIKHVSFREVWNAQRNGLPPPVDFEKAIVIVGVTARSMGDYHAAPDAQGSWLGLWAHRPRLMSGPEIHANIVATLADGAFITTPVWLFSFPLVVVFGAFLGLAYMRLKTGWGLVLAIVHHWLWKTICLAAFWYAHWRVEMLAMLGMGALGYGLISLVSYFAFWRQGQRILARTKSDEIAKFLAAHPEAFQRECEERVLTVLFADIRGFTAFSGKHTPGEVARLLNSYFDEIVPVVEEHGGVLNQYMGDGMMVLFGAPEIQKDHAARAVRAAVAMVERVHQRSATWVNLDWAGMRIGVGIATGAAIVGMVGSRNRLDYTAIGDTINSAARIESANKTLKSEILISARTYRVLVSDGERALLERVQPPQWVEVAGKSEPLEVHRVVVAGAAADGPPEDGRVRPLAPSGETP